MSWTGRLRRCLLALSIGSMGCGSTAPIDAPCALPADAGARGTMKPVDAGVPSTLDASVTGDATGDDSAGSVADVETLEAPEGASDVGESGAACAGPLVFADARIEHAVRTAAHRFGVPLSSRDVKAVSEIDMVLPANFYTSPTNDAPMSLQGIECLPGLDTIVIDGSVTFADFSPLGALPSLRRLALLNNSAPFGDQGHLPSLAPLGQLSVLELNVSNQAIPSDLASLTNLTSLTVDLDDLSLLAALPHLQTLTLQTGSLDFAALRSLTQLESLSIEFFNPPHDISALASLARLRSLDMSNIYELEELSPLASLTQLTSLSLSESAVNDWTPLASLTNLTSLSESSTGQLPLASMRHLTYLAVNAQTLSNSVQDLPLLLDLQEIELSDGIDFTFPRFGAMTQVRVFKTDGVTNDAFPLGDLTGLIELDVPNSKIDDLSPLASLTRLSKLDISGSQVVDLAPLISLRHLTSADVSGNPLDCAGQAANIAQLRSQGTLVFTDCP